MQESAVSQPKTQSITPCARSNDDALPSRIETAAIQLPFELDPQIIHHIIYSQAGSIGKAIIELIMNSVDSDSTTIRLALNGEGFSAVDDGKGFASREDVVRYFGRFGTPHEEGDATFGRFRLGRGQIMAHASTVWSSNSWKMSVDTRVMGYNYQLSDLETAQPGCSIVGQWYEQLDNTELLSVIQEIRDLVRYTPIAVELNGKAISKDPATEKWDYDDENCWVRVRADGAMHIYNQGVFVRHDAGHVWGVGGTVVTKKPIGLNVSRTEILRKSCPIWKAIAAVVKSEAAKFADSADQRRQTESRREKNAKALLSGTGDLAKIYSGEQVITLLPGARHVTLAQFIRRYGKVHDLALADTEDAGAGGDYSKLVGIVEHDYQVGKAEKLAFALTNVAFVHPKTLARFDCQSAAEFKEVIARIFDNLQATGTESKRELLHPRYIDYRILEKAYKPNYEILTANAIKDKNLRSAWTALKWCVEGYTSTYFTEGQYYPGARSRGRRLNVLLADCNEAQAWTDGESYIALNKKLVEAIGGRESLQAVTQIFAIVDHELAHEGDSVGASHDDAFYARYHDISLSMSYWKMFYIQCWLRKYTYALEGKGKPKSRWDYTGKLMDRASRARHKDQLPAITASVDNIQALQRIEPEEDPRIAAQVNYALIAAGVQPTTNWAQVLEDAAKSSDFKIAAQFAVDLPRIARVLGAADAELFKAIHEENLVRNTDFVTTDDDGNQIEYAELSTERLPEQDEDLADWMAGIVEQAVIKRYGRNAFKRCGLRMVEQVRHLPLDEWDDVAKVLIIGHDQSADQDDFGHCSEQDELNDSVYCFLDHHGILQCDQDFAYGEAWAMLANDTTGQWEKVLAEQILPRMAELGISPLEEDDDVARFTTPADFGFEEAIGRVPENIHELSEWERAGKPRLQPGETMWSLIRNANAVGYNTYNIDKYLEWRGDYELYYPHIVPVVEDGQ